MDQTSTSPNWARPYFEQPLHTNLLYYVIYGEVQGKFLIDGEKYRVPYMPQSLQLQSFRMPDGVETISQFRSGIFAKQLQEQHPELIETINQQEHCYTVQALLPDSETLNDFRVVIGVASYLLDSGGVALYDPLNRKWWTPQNWHEKVFEPQQFTPFPHVNIMASPETDGTHWIYTQGMRKFGRPDLSIHGVGQDHMDGVFEMINRFIGYMAGGGNIHEGQEIRMAALPEGMTCAHGGSFDDPNFNNVHVEIRWPQTL